MRLQQTCALAVLVMACSDPAPAGKKAVADVLYADANTPKGSVTPLLGGPPTVAGQSGPVNVKVLRPDGQPAKGTTVTFAVQLGGGQVAPATTTADANGVATATWTLGQVPVPQRVKVSAENAAAVLDVVATLPQPWTPTAFADVDAFLTAQKNDGSTEDLTFTADALVLGVKGGLLKVDAQGKTSTWALKGDALVAPLGVAADASGNVWVADSKGKALRRVAPDGTVTTAATGDGVQAFANPNDVAVDAAGAVWLTDTCLGELVRFDPVSAKVDRVVPFDLPTQGGPNGLAIGADGRVWMTTENAALFCPGKGGDDLAAKIAGLYVITPAVAKAQVVWDKAGTFGDGLAFDADGNLHVIFDQVADLQLAESAVWVLTPEAQAGKGAPQKYVAVKDRVYANLVFGKGAFGAGQLYLALLAAPPFTTARGLERLPVGLLGAP